MIGSKYRAKKLWSLVSEADQWAEYSNDLTRKEMWKNHGVDVWTCGPGDFLGQMLPRGYRYLGAGASRVAVLASDGLVYKVSTDHKDEDWEDHWMIQNEAEARAYKELARVRVKGIRLARTYNIHPRVNVAEYVRGKDGGEWGEDADKRYHEVFEEYTEKCTAAGWKLCDVYYDNIKMTKRGTFVIVDAGCFYPLDEPAEWAY